MTRLVVIVGSLLALAAGCSDDGDTTTDGPVLVDQAVKVDQGLLPDLPPLPDLSDLGGNNCDFEWQNAVSPHQKVSTGDVTTTDVGGGINETVVDASAGGVDQAIKNPFTYISFKDGAKVAIDDFAARKDSTWDIALRRTVIRINGGDSGPGQGGVSVAVNTPFDSVTAVPDAKSFLTDDFLDDNCVIQYNEINNIKTAFGGSTGRWYDFDTQNMKILLRPDTYVIKRANGEYVKVEVKAYYDATSGEGAHFTLRWTPLK